jgi:hypothetical protein
MHIHRIAMLIIFIIYTGRSGFCQEVTSDGRIAMPKGFVPPPGSKIMTPEELAKYSPMISASQSIVGPAAKRAMSLAKMSMSYRVTSRLGKCKIYESPDSTLVESDDGLVYAYSQNNGGFFLRKVPGHINYSILNILPADQAAGDQTAGEKFEKKCSLNAFAPRLHSSPRPEIMLMTTELLFGANIKIVSQEPGTGSLLKVSFQQVSLDSVPNSTGMSGTVIIDRSADCVITKLDYKSSGLGSANFYRDTRSYHPPAADIPFSLLNELNITEQAPGAKAPHERKFVFSDYKLESIPPEKLRLSYYGIDNSLTASKATPRWSYFIVVGVVALMGLGLWLGRRQRRRANA